MEMGESGVLLAPAHSQVMSGAEPLAIPPSRAKGRSTKASADVRQAS